MRVGALHALTAAATLLLAAANRLDAQSGATGLIDGRVRSGPTQQPIANATVRVAGTELVVVSSDDGRFRLRAPAGVVRLEVRAIGFAPIVRSDVVVSAGKPTTVIIDLQPRVVQLAGVEVKPTYFEPTRETPVSTQRFTAEEIRRTPGVQEDVIRAISVLPGVGVTTAGRNDLVVRGGAPFENLFVVDNIEVPNVNHFGTQGSTGGPVSLIPIEFVKDAALSAGGFGVRFGDRTSSVTTIALREGNRERFATTLNLSAIGFGGIVEGPLPNDGSLLVSVRRSYLDFVFNAVGFPFIPSYTDVTLKAVQRPSARDELSFLLVGARDRITVSSETADDRFDNSTLLGSSQDQYIAGATWKRLLPSGVLTTTLGRTWSRFDAAQRDSSNPPQQVFGAQSTEGETSLRSDLTLQLSPRAELSAGMIAKYAGALQYDITLPGAVRLDQTGVPRPLRVDTTFATYRQAVYVQNTLQLTDRVRLTLGARGDWYRFLRNTVRVAPRATLAWSPDEANTFTLAGGRYYQAPQPIWLVGDARNPRELKPLRADQIVAGWQRLLRPDLKLQVEAYAKSYADYPGRVFRPRAVLQPSGFDDVSNDIPYGLEPLLAAGHRRGAWRRNIPAEAAQRDSGVWADQRELQPHAIPWTRRFAIHRRVRFATGLQRTARLAPQCALGVQRSRAIGSGAANDAVHVSRPARLCPVQRWPAAADVFRTRCPNRSAIRVREVATGDLCRCTECNGAEEHLADCVGCTASGTETQRKHRAAAEHRDQLGVLVDWLDETRNASPASGRMYAISNRATHSLNRTLSAVGTGCVSAIRTWHCRSARRVGASIGVSAKAFACSRVSVSPSG